MANRAKRSRLMDEELADFFRERLTILFLFETGAWNLLHARAQIEENYSRQLAKLSKKQLVGERGLFR